MDCDGRNILFFSTLCIWGRTVVNTLSNAKAPKKGEGIPSQVGAAKLSQGFIDGFFKKRKELVTVVTT
tara:strand:- start:394 stop:597 length:204 start_codon:yes stop_codon:yes gene_type:complete